MLLIGSAEVYGPVQPDDLPLTEEHKLNPVTPYAVSKVAAEYLGVQYHAGFGVPVVRARSFNHIGPGQAGRFVVADIAGRIADAIKNGDTAPIKVGNLSARRDYTDVRDVARAYRLLVTEGEAGEAYNVCSGVDVSVETLAHRLLALAEVDLQIEEDPALMRPVDVPVLVGDNSRLRAATGWQPQIALDDTLRDVLAAFLQLVRRSDAGAQLLAGVLGRLLRRLDDALGLLGKAIHDRGDLRLDHVDDGRETSVGLLDGVVEQLDGFGAAGLEGLTLVGELLAQILATGLGALEANDAHADRDVGGVAEVVANAHACQITLFVKQLQADEGPGRQLP